MAKYNGLNGYIMSDFLRDISESYVEPEVPQDRPEYVPFEEVSPDLNDRVLLLEAQMKEVLRKTGIKVGG